MLNSCVKRCNVYYQILMHGVHNYLWYTLLTVVCSCTNITLVGHHNGVICPKTLITGPRGLATFRSSLNSPWI